MLGGSSKKFVNVVNADGTINPKELTKRYKQLLDYINKNITKSSTQSLSKPYQSSTGITTLKDHIKGVVQSAQQIPVPQGSSREELVRSALVHDIGKLLTGQDGSVKHARISADLLKSFNDPEFNKRSIRFAVKHHMYDKNFPVYGMNGKRGKLNYDLLKALQASDVARGLSYDKAALTYPQLFTYNKVLPKVKFYEGSLEDQLNNVIRPLLKRQGYPSSRDVFDLNRIQDSMNDFATRHRSVIRGARDPKKEINMSPRTIRNATNADLDASLQYGEVTPQTRLFTSLTTIPRNPTGSGRRGLFEVNINADTQLPYHDHPNRLARYLHVSPTKQDALYVSASNDIGQTYGSVERSRSAEGMIGKTTLPFQKMRLNEPLPEFYERINFQLYDGNKIIDGKTPMSTYQLLEEPYRLQTGRSLIADMQKAYEQNVGPIVEKIKNPKLKPLSVIPHEHILEINTLLEKMGNKPINFQHKSGK